MYKNIYGGLYMENIYADIAKRSEGTIMIGVVGPVRTGKSTFIKRFMDLLVIPNIQNAYSRERTKDELPQSGSGKTITTTEPKFIPNEPVEITLSENAKMNVKMIDCVGYIVPSAFGYLEDEAPRMVKTPWSDEAMPFSQAAEIGTGKVIKEHSTIGLVVTCDGSFSDIPRSEYEKAETRVIEELKEINKPFVVLLNCVNPFSENSLKIKNEIEQKHGVPALCVNCAELDAADINSIIEKILFEFPINEIAVNLPGWVDVLPTDHRIKKSIYADLLSAVTEAKKISDSPHISKVLGENENITSSQISNINLGSGEIVCDISIDDELFYKILGENTGFEIKGKQNLLSLMTELSKVKKEYDKIEGALQEVREVGYGIVAPGLEELSLEEPEIVRQGSRYGVRLKASAPSIHINRYKPKFLKTA
ncbi:MAG: stage IV sporulation protein A [Clostridia bacterium]|nr:stage IV sporulation protein A [Clostridia bacterium]